MMQLYATVKRNGKKKTALSLSVSDLQHILLREKSKAVSSVCDMLSFVQEGERYRNAHTYLLVLSNTENRNNKPNYTSGRCYNTTDKRTTSIGFKT